jgi:two-component system response regulator LytT
MLKKMRVMIVEDRPLARDELKYLLTLHPDVEVVCACEDTATAWPLIETGNVDGVFLDIETEGHRAGLDLAYRIDRLSLPRLPWLVFTTGYEEYALAAHQVRPFGYLVKPLDDAKVAQVLDRIRKAEQQQNTLKPPRNRIEIRHKTINRDETVWCIKYISPNEVLYIQTNNNGNTVKVQLVNGEVLDGVYIVLNRWKVDYDLPDFMQIHRSHLVNLSYVNGLKPDPFKIDGHNITFRGCATELSVGRNYLDELRKALGKQPADKR